MPDLFNRNVFINCPFDHDYQRLLRPLLFTLVYCRLHPRIASERLDSSKIRIEKIIELIQECRYSIHDLSRIKSGKKGEYYRLNMPLEIGLDMGCKLFHPDQKYRNKCSLILEGERFSTHHALSDLSGFDTKCHENKIEKLIEAIRNWLVEIEFYDVPGPELIWAYFNVFEAALYKTYGEKGFTNAQIDTMPTPELLNYVRQWIFSRP